MAKSTLPRDVLTALLGVADPDATSTAPPSRDYSLTRRVLAGLLGVQLPEHRPRRPTGHPRPPATTGRPRFRRFLLLLAGADPGILARIPTEQIKFESLGWAILITSGMATVSMWFALTTALGMNSFVAALPALAWGLVILGIDRWLIISLPLGNARRKLVAAVPRLMLALILGTVISTPLVLRIFQPEINAQLVLIKEQRYSAELTGLQHSALRQQINQWQAEVNDLQAIIAADGKVSLNPTADPVVQSLTKQRATAIAQEQFHYREWNCQLYGGPGCLPAGNGPAAQDAHHSYQQAALLVTQINADISAREQTLTSTSAASANARLQQAKGMLPSAQHHLATTQKQLNTLQESLTATINDSNGLLDRLSALSQLSSNNPTVGTARLLLLLLFLVIELLPVTVKLLQAPGSYEVLLARQEEMRMKVLLIRRQAMTGQDDEPPIIRSLLDSRRPQADVDAGPPPDPDSLVPDDLRREIEAIYPFMNETGEGSPPQYREELENCFLAISKGANDLLRRGYDTEQIIEALQFLTDTITRQLADARQAVLEQSTERGQG
jgi:hypothetical protein